MKIRSDLIMQQFLADVHIVFRVAREIERSRRLIEANA